MSLSTLFCLVLNYSRFAIPALTILYILTPSGNHSEPRVVAEWANSIAGFIFDGVSTVGLVVLSAALTVAVISWHNHREQTCRCRCSG